MSASSEHPGRSGQAPGAYAQAKFEDARRRSRMKLRAALPLVVAIALITMVAAFLALQQFGPAIAAIGSVALGAGFAWLVFRLPFDALSWAKGVEGERKTGELLEPLGSRGFVVLYNRLVPGSGGDIDALVIGPTGIFVVETKNWRNRMEVLGDRLFAGEREQGQTIGQVYRQAVAVQVTLGQELNALRATVTPVICAIGGVAGPTREVGGVQLTNGDRLVTVIERGSRVFDEGDVQRLAGLADRRLRLAYDWEGEG